MRVFGAQPRGREARRADDSLVDHPRGRTLIRLRGQVEVTQDGLRAQVPPGAQRLLAFLAVQRGPAPRTRCAEALWENERPARAGSNLRSTLWRLNRTCEGLVRSRGDLLMLSDDLTVDSGEPTDVLARLKCADSQGDRVAMSTIVSAPTVLPGWSDLWMLVERERVRLLWVEALDVAATQLAVLHPTAALVAARAAVELEPLQETAWRQIVAIHLEQGNLASAQRAYAAYRRMLRDELGLAPSPLIQALLGDLIPE